MAFCVENEKGEAMIQAQNIRIMRNVQEPERDPPTLKIPLVLTSFYSKQANELNGTYLVARSQSICGRIQIKKFGKVFLRENIKLKYIYTRLKFVLF